MNIISNNKILFLANGMAAVMDFGVGALIAVVISLAFDSTITPITLLLGGIFALLPDFDVLPHILMGKEVTFDHHQTLWHRPALVLVVVGGLLYVFGTTTWCVIAVICLIYHYLHDTGWVSKATGIAWLWPFSARAFSWFGFYDQVPSDHHPWLQNYWCTPTARSVSELGIGISSLVLALHLSELDMFWYAVPCIFIGSTMFVWVHGTR
jgi:hypothetical protein